MQKDRINTFLLILIILLGTGLVPSFFPGKGKSINKVSVKTCLLNPLMKKDADFFELKSGTQVLDFQKKGGNWFCGYYTDEGSFFIPAKNEKVEELLSELCRYKSYTTIKGHADDFSLSDENAFVIRVMENGSLRELYFGDSDFSGTGRYVSADGKNVMLTDRSFEKFLYVSERQWSDPYLLTRNTGIPYRENDVMNVSKTGILELRHGGISFFVPENSSVPEKVFKIFMGDTSEYRLKFFRVEGEGRYHVEVEYENPSGGKKMEYAVSVSEWTYKKLEEIVGEVS